MADQIQTASENEVMKNNLLCSHLSSSFFSVKEINYAKQARNQPWQLFTVQHKYVTKQKRNHPNKKAQR